MTNYPKKINFYQIFQALGLSFQFDRINDRLIERKHVIKIFDLASNPVCLISITNWWSTP